MYKKKENLPRQVPFPFYPRCKSLSIAKSHQKRRQLHPATACGTLPICGGECVSCQIQQTTKFLRSDLMEFLYRNSLGNLLKRKSSIGIKLNTFADNGSDLRGCWLRNWRFYPTIANFPHNLLLIPILIRYLKWLIIEIKRHSTCRVSSSHKIMP